MSMSKATGLAALSGGMAELLVVWGVGAMIVSQVAAIRWLSRSFSREHWARTLFSALSICMSSLMLALVAGFLLMTWFRR